MDTTTTRLLADAHAGLDALILLARSALVTAARLDDEDEMGEQACLLEYSVVAARKYLEALYPERSV